MISKKENDKKKNNEITINVKREFIGNVTPIQAVLPIVMEDIKRKYEENCKIDNEKKTN